MSTLGDVTELAEDASPVQLSPIECAALYSGSYSFGEEWVDELDRLAMEVSAPRRLVIDHFLEQVNHSMDSISP